MMSIIIRASTPSSMRTIHENSDARIDSISRINGEEDYISAFITCTFPFVYLIDFRDAPNSGGALTVSIYAPYLVWNLTNSDLELKSKSFLRQADSISYKIKPSTFFLNAC